MGEISVTWKAPTEQASEKGDAVLQCLFGDRSSSGFFFLRRDAPFTEKDRKDVVEKFREAGLSTPAVKIS